MADIPMEYLNSLTNAINQVTGASRQAAQATLEQLIASGQYENAVDLVGDALRALEPLFDELTKAAASLSAEAYDIVRMAQLGEAFGAQPYQDRDPEWTRKALEGAAHKSKSMDAFIKAALDRLDYEAKRAAGSTQFANGVDDKKGKPRFARVPTGKETCPFCIMLASRGFVYRSSKLAGQLNHYHAHCDCRVIAGFNGGKVAGYDPDAYLHQYEQMLDEGTLNEESLSRSATRAHKRPRELMRG